MRMIRDKDLTEEAQVFLGVFTASEAEAYSTFSAGFQGLNLTTLPYFVPFLLHVLHFRVSALNSHFPDPEVRNPRSDVYSGCT